MSTNKNPPGVIPRGSLNDADFSKERLVEMLSKKLSCSPDSLDFIFKADDKSEDIESLIIPNNLEKRR